MSIADKLLNFFAAENTRDWETYSLFLHPDVEWTCFGTPERNVVSGREDYITAMRQAYGDSSATFTVEHLVADEEAGVIVAELEIQGRRSVDIFELRDGLIYREREYFDDIYWRASSNA